MILCSERKPDNPARWTKRYAYLTRAKYGSFYVMEYANGWNCHCRMDGSVDHTSEIKDIVAWDYLPNPDDERWRRDTTPPNPKKVTENTCYLTLDKNGYYGVTLWGDGWNCMVNEVGEYLKEHEFHDVVAWMPLTEFEVPCEMCTEDCEVKHDFI